MQQELLVGRSKNVFEEIRMRGNDDNFIPVPCEHPCHHDAGSKGRIETLVRRIRRGEDLWHPLDTRRAATHEQVKESNDAIAAFLMADEKAPLHIKQKQERKQAIEAIRTSPEYVTAVQLQSEFRV